jgi:hypothetical protein
MFIVSKHFIAEAAEGLFKKYEGIDFLSNI